IWFGGNKNQTSLAQSFMDKVKVHDLEKQKRQSKESFGDFTARIVRFGQSDTVFFVYGFEKLKENAEKWEGPVVAPTRYNLMQFCEWWT
ncbi:hypothetical protein S83_007026, partial [Arachis hypogaea]